MQPSHGKENPMTKTRITTIALAVVALAVVALPIAHAGSPHYVGDPTVTRDGDVLTVSGKLAGLGNEEQVHVVLTADVQCVNPGGNEPQAENKGAVIAEGDFPVQNGKALFTLSGVGTTDPDCAPPMTLVYSNVVVSVPNHGLTFAVAGTF
jgi:hypothetical protein